jgi:O-6-methylguanine DNA methyltransferase
LPETRVSEAREPPKLGIILVGMKPPALLPCRMGMEPDEVPADLSGTTPFQRRVLEVVKGIPLGEVRPYAWVAREAGSPKASRAVGSVMANNLVPLLVPCHRIVRNDGRTGQYAFSAREKSGCSKVRGSRSGRSPAHLISPHRPLGSSATPPAATPGG